MSNDIFHDKSVAELKKEIDAIVGQDARSLPPKAKTFAAVAKLQGYDMLPDVVEPGEMQQEVGGGAIELNRGMSGTKGVQAAIYARDLLYGPMYPGTLSAYGNGIYFAVPGQTGKLAAFPKISEIARMYATPGDDDLGPGVIVRAILKPSAKIADCQELKACFRDNRNRAHNAGITDLGAFAAALGFDAYHIDDCYDHTDERVFVVVNRGALIFQKIALKVPPRT